MAKNVTLTDDLTGETGAETRTFTVNGRTLTIDLTDDNARELDKAVKAVERAMSGIEKFVTCATKSTKSYGPNPHAKAAREWAVANGMEVPARGRLSSDILTAYEASLSV